MCGSVSGPGKGLGGLYEYGGMSSSRGSSGGPGDSCGGQAAGLGLRCLAQPSPLVLTSFLTLSIEEAPRCS